MPLVAAATIDEPGLGAGVPLAGTDNARNMFRYYALLPDLWDTEVTVTYLTRSTVMSVGVWADRKV